MRALASKQMVVLAAGLFAAMLLARPSAPAFGASQTPSRLVANPQPPAYAALATSAQKRHAIQGRAFWFTLGGGEDSPTLLATLKRQPLADRGLLYCAVGEWEYSFHHLRDGQQDGAGTKHFGGYPTPPQSRADAARVVRDYYLRLREQALAKAIAEQRKCFVSFNGHYCYQHYACEWGCDAVGSEVGENINSIQAHIAFTRGAARQYGKPWLMDFSSWYGPSIFDEDPKRHWGEYSGPTHGHSLSLHLRTYLVSYMAGANVVVAEGGWLNFFRSQQPQADGTLPLSALGREGARFYRFTRRHPDRGIPYAPVALLIPVHHGIYPGFGDKTAWNAFPYTHGDQSILDSLNAFFPGSLELLGRQTESEFMVASPLGDIVDVLLANAPLDRLLNYRVLLLAGEFESDSALAARLRLYVERGGTLLISKADSERQFTSGPLGPAPGSLPSQGFARREVGRGAAVVFDRQPGGDSGANQPLAALLRQVRRETIPLRVTGRLQTLYNRTRNGWLVTLVNNQGVTKAFRETAFVDPGASQTVAVFYLGPGEVRAAHLWAPDADEELDPRRVRVTIPPGEVRIVHLAVG